MDFTTMSPESLDDAPDIYAIRRAIVICTHVFCIIVSLATIVLLTNQDVFKDCTKLPLMNYAIASLLFAVYCTIHIAGLQTIYLDEATCSFVNILNDTFTVARGLAILFVIIDLVDWIRNSKAHDRRMTKRAYCITVGVLWLVSFIVGLGRAIPVWADVQECRHRYNDQTFTFLTLGLLVICLILPIIAGCFYRKRVEGEHDGDKTTDQHTAKEALIVVLVLCLVFLVLTVAISIPPIGAWMSAIQLIYDGIAMLVCIFVFHQLRNVCCFFCKK